jgi:hypothetical protein
MVKTMTFMVKKMAKPRRASIQAGSPASLFVCVTARANRQPKQQ